MLALCLFQCGCVLIGLVSLWLGRLVVCDLLLLCLERLKCRWLRVEVVVWLGIRVLRLELLIRVEGWVRCQVVVVDGGEVGVRL